MTNELATTQDLIFSPETITKETVKKYLCPKANDQELIMAVQICKEFKLNPLKKEIYFIKYTDSPDEKMSIVLGYEVFLKRADRTGKYVGLRTWTEGKVDDKSLKGCVEITVKGWEKPLYHEVEYSEYAQYKKDGTLNRFWKGKPKTMIKKVAVAQGFKLAFPDELAGLPMIAEEIDDNSIVDIEIDSSKSRVEQIVEQQFVTEKDLKPEVKEDEPKEEVKPEVKAEKPKEQKTTVKKEDSKSDTKPDVGQPSVQVNPVVIGLIDNEAQGANGEIICVKVSSGPIMNPNTNKADIKYSFLIDDKYYGTWDTELAKQIIECVDNRIMVKIEFKERKNEKGKMFQDIVSFKQATIDEVKPSEQ